MDTDEEQEIESESPPSSIMDEIQPHQIAGLQWTTPGEAIQ
jgi:hypothetical protein